MRIRESTTVPTPRDVPTVLPLALETFSSVSNPVDHRPHGSHHNGHHPNGQHNVNLELAPLTTTTSPPPPATQGPHKLSTFMYVQSDGGDKVGYIKTNSIVEKSPEVESEPEIRTTEFSVDDNQNSELDENIGNTENVWSVMMQLGPTNTPDENTFDISSSGSGSSEQFDEPSPTFFLDSEDDWSKMTTSSSISEKEMENSNNNDQPVPTSFPGLVFKTNYSTIPTSTDSAAWASSTYAIQTFQYPEPYSESSSVSDSVDIGEPLVREKHGGPVFFSSEETSPEIKLTTWFGDEPPLISGSNSDPKEGHGGLKIFSFVHEREENKDRSTTTTTTTTTTPRPTTTTTTTSRPTTTTMKPTTTSTTTTTTVAPTTTSVDKISFWHSPYIHNKIGIPMKPYTLPPWKKPQVRVPVTTEMPTTTTTIATTTTGKPTTSTTTTTTTTERPTTTTTTKAPEKITTFRTPVTKETPLESIHLNPPLSEDDLDANLDNFVDQVSKR